MGLSPPQGYFVSATDCLYSWLAKALAVHSACSQQVNVSAGNSDKLLTLSNIHRPDWVLLILTGCAQGMRLISLV